MSLKTSILSLAALGLLAGSAQAHHSALMFDRAKTVSIEGTAKSWEWTNPHCWLQVMTLKDGASVQYNIESAAVNLLIRRGWTPTTVAAGDKLKVLYHPLRDGAPGGELVAIIRPDGSRLDTLAPGSR